MREGLATRRIGHGAKTMKSGKGQSQCGRWQHGHAPLRGDVVSGFQGKQSRRQHHRTAWHSTGIKHKGAAVSQPLFSLSTANLRY